MRLERGSFQLSCLFSACFLYISRRRRKRDVDCCRIASGDAAEEQAMHIFLSLFLPLSFSLTLFLSLPYWQT